MDILSAFQRIVETAQHRSVEDAQSRSVEETRPELNHADASLQRQAFLQDMWNKHPSSTYLQQQTQVDADNLLSQLGQLNWVVGNRQASRSHPAGEERQQPISSAAVNNHMLGQQLNSLQASKLLVPATGQSTGIAQPQPHAVSLPSRADTSNGHTSSPMQQGKQAGVRTQQQTSEQQKRRRGRPPSGATNTHPNLVYVRRFRERQKQMENELEATLAEKRRQLERLELEQRQLCTRWEALEQVLHVQTGVLQLMQNLTVQEGQAAEEQHLQLLEHMPSPSITAAEQDDSSGVSAAQQHADAVSFATAAIRAAAQTNAGLDLLKDRKLLLLQARNWLEPVRLYTLRSALMLEQLGILPMTAAAEAALIAARSCPHVGGEKVHFGPTATADAIEAAITAALAEGGPAAAATAAASVAAAVRSAWVGCQDALDGHDQHVGDGVPMVRYPYSIGMYVITPPAIKDLVWPMNMDTWQIDDGNDQKHTELAARAMWAVMGPERWRLLKATWLTMGSQLQQVQQDLARLHEQLRRVGARKPVIASGADSSRQNDAAAGAVGSDADPGSSAEHGPSLTGFMTFDESSAYEYAAAVVEVENVLLREDAISFQLCGAFLDLLDPIEMAVGFVGSWPYHPQVFTLMDVLFRLGEPPEQVST